MAETLNNFQQEWYEMRENGNITSDIEKIPEEYVESEKFKDEIRGLKD